MKNINVFDTTLRDGEQTPGVNLNFEEKLQIAKQLERLGVDIIEAGFPAASKGDLRSVKEIADTVKNSSVTGLSRALTSDIDACWEALKGGAEPRIHVFLATSPIHREHKLHMTQAEVIETAVNAVRYAKERFAKVQFSAEDACRTELPFLAEVVEAVIDAGADVVNLPDTVGFIMPEEIRSMFRYIKSEVPNADKAVLSAHCHDDLGMATANSLAAVEGGAEQVECTINAVGERAGNASLEEIAVALHIRNDFYGKSTNITLNEIKRTSSLVSSLMGMQVPNNKAVVGDNAFAHESGIHQDGVLKETSTYEIITPELVGVEANRMVLGKLSGRHAFKEKIISLGYNATEEEINKVFKSFKELADKKKEITNEDIFALMADEKAGDAMKYYSLETLQVTYGTSNIPTATVTVLDQAGERIEHAGTGSGSVEALYNTLEKIVGEGFTLQDYRIQSTTGGRDALAEVFVRLAFEETESSGRGTDNDVLEASAKAYINAVNRVLNQRRAENQPKVANISTP
ncbi:2-isopropylmalate synthase [Marinococcus luteus]|uniref:2-isopropylmalate synthase n=1 Tax=Marinococcus luteus TaxID=1122204 RepID=UPI002ACC42FE|nr:2-isopropylmalate synthase [Marinococcus luteus]MDZ5783738.1 2-isopropylmalate synthase [Marinococcus luteus]